MYNFLIILFVNLSFSIDLTFSVISETYHNSQPKIIQIYSKENIPDKSSFLDSLEMIIRQVQSIGTLVDEFSSFARMPQPSIKLVDIVTKGIHFL